jgi:Tfp pilus assembly protein FimT
LIELLIVVAIATVLTAGAIPIVSTTMSNMHLGSAASSLSGAIQSARYQAIATGCPIQIAVSSGTYQLSNEPVIVTGTPPVPACSTTYSSLGGAVPYSSPDISLSPDTTQTLQLNPSGTITAVGSLAAQNFTLVLALSNSSATKTVTVSGVGNVKVH